MSTAHQEHLIAESHTNASQLVPVPAGSPAWSSDSYAAEDLHPRGASTQDAQTPRGGGGGRCATVQCDVWPCRAARLNHREIA